MKLFDGVAISGLGVALIGWALERLVEPLNWLPLVAAPLGLALLATGLAFRLTTWLRSKRRKALDGLSVQLAIQIRDQPEPRRRYVFDYGDRDGVGAAFYRSRSDRFIFEVRDARGEPYALELQEGPSGIPLEKPLYLILEAGNDRGGTTMRVIVNGRVAIERRLPFEITLGQITMNVMTFGARRGGGENGRFHLSRYILAARTLTDQEAKLLTADALKPQTA